MTTAILAALGATLLYGLASVAQGFAARRTTGPAVVRHPAYLAGIAADVGAWALSLVAMTQLPLFVVQSMLAASLGVAVLVAWPVLKLTLRRQDWAGVAVATAGVALVSACAGAESSVAPPGWFTPALGACLAVVAVVGCLGYRRARGVLFAALAGLAFSLAALAGRAVMGAGDVGWHVLESPLAWSVAIAGVLGTLFYARALERGSFGSATAVMWVVESLVPGIVGIEVLGDQVRDGRGPAAVAGVLLSLAGCVTLALSPTQKKLAAD